MIVALSGRVVVATAALILGPGIGHSQSSANDLLTEAIRDCALWDEGFLHIGEQAVTAVDLTGDGTPETLVDTGHLHCSATPISPYCGPEGCALFAFVGDDRFVWPVLGWRVIDWDGDPVLLLQRDGGWCGTSSASHCYEALYWSGDTFMTVRPSGE